MSALDITRITNAAKSLNNQGYVNFESIPDKKILNQTLAKNLFETTPFCSIDLLGFPYEHHHFRDFTVLHLLHCIWKEAKSRFIDRKINGGPDSLPLFIIIDEAHNLAPSKLDVTQSSAAQEVARMVRTIAAEGRKFGLFLVLISQRPDKIDENILSECDNFIIMKSTPPTIDILAKFIGKTSDKNCVKDLEPAVSFQKGQAFYYGAFTPNRELVKVEGDIKRTK